MKRLCVFYYKAYEWLGCNVEWIICKKCQKELRVGSALRTHWTRPKEKQ